MTEIKDAKLRDLNARAEGAQARYLEGEKHLFRSDDSKLYSDEAHKEELKKLTEERNGVLREVEEEAREIRMAVASEVERIENADPADALSPEELEQANQKRAFALDAAETLDTEAFGKRLGAVLAAGDRGSVFAYWMAGQRKSKERDGRVPFGEVLDKMKAALGGDRRTGEVEKAKRRETEAFGVESLAHHLQLGVRDAYGAHSKRTCGHVAERLGRR